MHSQKKTSIQNSSVQITTYSETEHFTYFVRTSYRSWSIIFFNFSWFHS